MQNFSTAELRPVERARAYLRKKMLKKALREDAGADVLRDSLCCTKRLQTRLNSCKQCLNEQLLQTRLNSPLSKQIDLA